jgi:type I restriction enzyme M protein
MAKDKKEPIGFEKALQKIAYKHTISNVFDDFLQMTVCAFSIGCMEDEYKKIASRYDKDELQLFSEALAEMTNEYHKGVVCNGWCDVLGTTFENVNSSKQASNSGQFFTPETVCNLMSKLTHDDTFIPENVADCACGSGRNLLAHRALRDEHRTQTFYHAYDLDKRCVLMSVINYVMHGMHGVVIHMDALTLEVYGGYRIYLPETGLFVKPMTINQCKHYLYQKKEKEAEKQAIAPVQEVPFISTQLSLF